MAAPVFTEYRAGEGQLKLRPFENDLCDGVLGRVRDGEVCGTRARLFVEFADATAKDENGRTRIARGYFDVLPGDAARPACLQSFERGFFGGEARGIMLRGDRPATVAISTLALCVNALDKTRRARDNFADTPNFDNVYTYGNNHGRSRTNTRRIPLARKRQRARPSLRAP